MLRKSLSIHRFVSLFDEWGTFTSVAGEDGSAIDWNVLGGKDDLPNFVKYERYRCFKFRLSGTVRMETPVVYFYSKRELTAHVTVAFPHGVVTEWYPKGDTAIYESKSLIGMMHSHLEGAVYQTATLMNPPPPGLDSVLIKLSPSMNGIDTSLRNLMSTITWKDVKVQPDMTPELPMEDRPSRYYAARATDADPMAMNTRNSCSIARAGGAWRCPLTAQISSRSQKSSSPKMVLTPSPW